MNTADSGVNTVNLLSATTAYDFTANSEAGLVIADHNTGADVITAGAASQQVWTWSGNDTVVETGATAADVWAHPGSDTTLEFTGGGAVTMNANDTGLNAVVLEASSSAYTFKANGEVGLVVTDDNTGADTLKAGAAGQTLTGGAAGKDSFALTAAGSDTVKDASALLNGDTISNFGSGTGNVIDLTDMNSSSLVASFRENESGTSSVLTLSDGTHTAAITLFGQFAAAGFSGTAAAAGFTAANDGGTGTRVTWAIAAPAG